MNGARSAIAAIVFALAWTSAFALNPVQTENARPGTAGWELSNPATAREIEGFASLTSVNRGSSITFYVSTSSPTYTLEVYRMGWYSGVGARRLLGPISLPGSLQVTPAPDPRYGTFDCNWSAAYVLTPTDPDPSVWASGIYLAKLTASSTGKQSYIIFVIRDDTRSTDFLFQSSVTTYQAYNNWPGSAAGGKSIYPSNSSSWQNGNQCSVFYNPSQPNAGIPAIKVSFNRPYGIRENPTTANDPNGTSAGQDYSKASAAYGVGAGEFLTTLNYVYNTTARGEEYNMVRFLERNGYDVSYATNIDTQTLSRLLNHKGILSVGHDEYWSKAMRDNFEYARDNGINIGFFSANTGYTQIRLEPTGTAADRLLVEYREGGRDYHYDTQNHVCDGYDLMASGPSATGRFRAPPLNRPEYTLIGSQFCDGSVDTLDPSGHPFDPIGFACDIIGPGPAYSAAFQLTDASSWVTTGTGMTIGSTIPFVVGYEVDTLPATQSDWITGLRRIGHSQIAATDSSGAAHAYSDMVTYQAPSAAVVFSAASIQWSWGLDDYNADANLKPHNSSNPLYPNDNSANAVTNADSAAAEAITKNVLARFRSNNRTDIFGRAPGGAMYHKALDGGVWQPWEFLDGGFNSGPAAASWAPNQLSVFGTGLDNKLYLNQWSGTAWSGWTFLGAPNTDTLASSPAAVSRAASIVDVFARVASDNSIWQRSYNGTSWQAWQPLGGGFISAPAASSWGASELTVFGLGYDSQLYNNLWNGTSWTGWVSLGKPASVTLTLDPAAVSSAQNRIDAFVLGSDHAIWRRSYDGTTWGAWSSLGAAPSGQFISGPAASSWGPNRLYVFATASDSHPYVNAWNGTAWSGWSMLDGGLNSAPAAVSWYGRQ